MDTRTSGTGNQVARCALDTDAFYRHSVESGYVKVEDIARNQAWTTSTAWGDIEITVNLSKPEKDPRAIAAAATAQADGERSYVDPATGRVRACPLCVEQADLDCGYAQRLELGGEPWALWYSPYAYYDEHCIAMCWQHRPMHVDRAAFSCLFDAVDALPQYFFGSNADLPVVGGSILGHDHFQGGAHVFPMQKAPVEVPFEMAGYPQVKAGIVKWPVSVVRLCGADRGALVDCACAVLDAWCAYDDADAGIVSGFAGEPAAGAGFAGEPAAGASEPFSAGREKRHNTITPILRREGDVYQLDLALRCNIASAEHPLGVFHPHERLHHIKKENIGLIEVMGLAILPPRVLSVMDERGLSRDDVGRLFAEVLECAGVFKWDDSGKAAFARFVRQFEHDAKHADGRAAATHQPGGN